MVPVCTRFQVSIKGKFSNINWGLPQGCIFGSLLFLLNVHDLLQVVDCDLLFDSGVSCLVYQKSDVKEIGQKKTKFFLMFVIGCSITKLTFISGEDKTKIILFGTKKKLNKECMLLCSVGILKLQTLQINVYAPVWI